MDDATYKVAGVVALFILFAVLFIKIIDLQAAVDDLREQVSEPAQVQIQDYQCVLQLKHEE